MSAAAAAAAGGAATVAGGPALGGVTGAAAKQAVEEALAEFGSANQQALDELLVRTQGVELLLGEVHSDLQTLLDSDWRKAVLHIEDAAKHPDDATDALVRARDLLYGAITTAGTSLTRALIAQQVSAVYAMLGRVDDSRDWFRRAISESADSVAEQADSVVDLVYHTLHDQKPPRRTPRGRKVPKDKLMVAAFLPAERTGTGFNASLEGYVPREPVSSGLVLLANSTLDLHRLKATGVPTGWTGPWSRDPRNRLKLQDPVRGGGLSVECGENGICIFVAPDSEPLPADDVLRSGTNWSFHVENPHSDEDELYVAGSIPELGLWREDQARLMYRLYKSVRGVSVWTLGVAEIGSVEYKYFSRSGASGNVIWEPGPNRRLRQTENSGYDREPIWQMEDTWGSAAE